MGSRSPEMQTKHHSWKEKISAATINSEINRLEETVNDTFFFFEQTGQIPTSLEFRDEVNRRNGKIVEKEEKQSSITTNNSLLNKVRKTVGQRTHTRDTRPQ